MQFSPGRVSGLDKPRAQAEHGDVYKRQVHAGPIAAPTGAADQQCGMAKRIQCVCSGYKQIIRSHCLQGLLQTGINISDFSPLIEQKMGALALRVGSFHPVFCNSSADTHRGVSQQRSQTGDGGGAFEQDFSLGEVGGEQNAVQDAACLLYTSRRSR